eukprot:CAMPEP_0184509974 /NCGR_PEP_ID=MMETSP0198_2-20121128/1564_1 /TAXON_ID=1112570 /ORGANISM="Thraustochytrium sp., Strain LLF1b" /LENGTH=46 /DNA_ID= /DNA_START= /DNA_END= /DNA_ORIENTATION=
MAIGAIYLVATSRVKLRSSNLRLFNTLNVSLSEVTLTFWESVSSDR